MQSKDGKKYASARSRVVNMKTGFSGNLVEWPTTGKECTVFVGYQTKGHNLQQVYAFWPKTDTESAEVGKSLVPKPRRRKGAK